MNRELAEDLLRAVMGQAADATFPEQIGVLRSLATYKYNDYQQYTPGNEFIESLALWLGQFNSTEERRHALRFIRERLVYISDAEMRHLVTLMARDRVPAIIQRDVRSQARPSTHIVLPQSGTTTYTTVPHAHRLFLE